MSHQPTDGTWATSPDSRAWVGGEPTGAASFIPVWRQQGPWTLFCVSVRSPGARWGPTHVHVADSVPTLVGFYHAAFPSVFSSLPSAQTELGERCWHGRLDGQVGRISEPGLHSHG